MPRPADRRARADRLRDRRLVAMEIGVLPCCAGLQFQRPAALGPSVVRAGGGHRSLPPRPRACAPRPWAPRPRLLPDCLRRNGAWSGTPSTRRRRCPHRPRPRPPPAGLSSRPQCLAPLSSACVRTGSSLLGDVVTSVGRRGKLIPWRLEELAPPRGGELMTLASPKEYHLRLLVCGERACCRRR
jgi:hypothetical protein